MTAPGASHPALRDEPVSPPALAELAAAGRLFAVVDPCDAPTVLQRIIELGDAAVSLFEGAAAARAWAVAPRLAAVTPPLLAWIMTELAATPWGIFVVAPLPLADVRRQLRRVQVVRDPAGHDLFFRFYDPRVLPPFLASCTPAQIAAFFGPLTAIGVVTPARAALLSPLASPTNAPAPPTSGPIRVSIG
jgi:hypothetical protein